MKKELRNPATIPTHLIVNGMREQILLLLIILNQLICTIYAFSQRRFPIRYALFRSIGNCFSLCSALCLSSHMPA